MRSAARWMVAAAAAAAMAGAAQEAPPPPATAVSWQCWHAVQNPDSITCRLRPTAGALAAAEAQAESPSPPPARHPSLLHTLRNAPEQLGGETVLVPLYGPPVDWERVARLARVAMCGTRADCSVEFSRLPPG